MRQTAIACHLERTNDMPDRKDRVNDKREIAMSVRDLEMAASSKMSSPKPAKKRSNAMQVELKRAKESVMINIHSHGFPVRVALPFFDPSLK